MNTKTTRPVAVNAATRNTRRRSADNGVRANGKKTTQAPGTGKTMDRTYFCNVCAHECGPKCHVGGVVAYARPKVSA